jgi:hypothetical protein
LVDRLFLYVITFPDLIRGSMPDLDTKGAAVHRIEMTGTSPVMPVGGG